MAHDEAALQHLRALLARVNHDSPDKLFRDAAEMLDAQQSVITRFSTLFASENLPQLTADEFKDFLVFRNNRHWNGLHRRGPEITADMDALRSALKLLMDESIPIRERLDQLRPANQDGKVKFMGRALITAILHVTRSDSYGVWNNTSEGAMRKLELIPQLGKKASFGERYSIINSRLLDISRQLRIDLWTLDMLWWLLLSSDGDAKPLSTDTVPADSEPADLGGVFGLERFLHEFLVENWAKLDLGHDWELHTEDGELVGSHYQTGEVGEIDLLARHKKENRWLVIELKRDQSSDSTVGQLLRYMSWVRLRLAEPGACVQGMVVCGQLDTKLQFALDGQSNIECRTYAVSFKLNSAPGLQ